MSSFEKSIAESVKSLADSAKRFVDLLERVEKLAMDELKKEQAKKGGR